MQSLKDLALMMSKKRQTLKGVFLLLFFKCENILSPLNTRKSLKSGIFMVYLTQ